MPRYVEVENLKVSDYVTVWDCNCSEFGKQLVMAVDDLQYLPDADVQEVKHAKWLTYRLGLGVVTCSNCGAVYDGGDSFRFCPKCGAKMDLGEV